MNITEKGNRIYIEKGRERLELYYVRRNIMRCRYGKEPFDLVKSMLTDERAGKTDESIDIRTHEADDRVNITGGGVEAGEDLSTAILRELKEELGADVEIICKIGVVSDFYNLIHRHNINNYYLCRVKSFGERHLMPDEIEQFHLSTLKLTHKDATAEYERCAVTPLGRLVANRELPILRRAIEILNESERRILT